MITEIKERFRLLAPLSDISILVEAGHILEYGEKIVRRVKQNLFNGEYNETGKPKNRTRQIFDRFQLFYRTTVSAQETVFEAVKQIIDTD